MKGNGTVQSFAILPQLPVPTSPTSAVKSLLQRVGLNLRLTGRGEERLHYFDLAGCTHSACPLCQRKAGSYQCPCCGYHLVTPDHFLGMTLTSLVAVQSNIHPGPNLPGQVIS